MYRLKIRRGHKALRVAASAVALGGWIYTSESSARADSVFSPSFGSWSTAGNWTPSGIPTNGTVADILSDAEADYTVPGTSSVDLAALQLAGGTNLATSAELLMQSGSTLEAGNIYLGGTNTGQHGYQSGTGPGYLYEDPGNVYIDPGGVLAVGSTSEYQMVSSSNLTAYNEQLAGLFIENSGSNALGAGSTLNNSGNYIIENSGALAADYIINSGTFNQSTSSVVGVSTSNTNFNNSGTYLFSSPTGTFTGFMTNNLNGTVNINASAIPFSQGILNNGQMIDTSGTGTYAGSISGKDSMIFTGTQTVTLTGTDTFSGSTNISGGTLTLAAAGGGALTGIITVYPTATLAFGASSQFGSGAALIVNGGTVNLAANNESIGSVAVNTGQFNLSGTGYLSSSSEQIAGTFNQNGSSSNILTSGSNLNNSGTYLLQGSATLAADTIINSSTFNQSGATIHGTTTSSTSFNNSGAYLYNAGTFTGYMINNVGATINVTGAPIPFSQGILENGQMTVSSGSGSYAGIISGTGNIIFNGSQSDTLTGTNPFSGLTDIFGGTLTLSAPGGGALQGNVVVGSAGTLTFGASAQLASTTVLTLNSGVVNLASYNESVGSLNINAGQIQQTSGLGLGIVTGQVVVGAGSAAIAGGLLSNSTFNFNVSMSGTLTVSGAITSFSTSNPTALYLTGPAAGGGGTLIISAASLLTSIDINKGILEAYEGGTFGGYNTTTTVESAGTFNLNGQTITIGDLSGSGAVALGAGSLTINSVAGSTFSGTVNGTGSLIKNGTTALLLSGNDYASGTTTVNAGTLTVAANGSIGSSFITAGSGSTVNLLGTVSNTPAINATGTVNFGAYNGSGILIRSLGPLAVGSNAVTGNGQVNVALATSHANRTLLVSAGLTFTGTTNAWSGQLDLSNNDMVVSNGDITTLTNLVKSGFNGGNWKGNGITSTAAASNTRHLTAIGVIQNNNGSSYPVYGSYTALGSFDGYNPAVADVLIKYTYVGDANLDGKVDGSDYSLIDNGYLNHLTGWYNGDFNYDGVVNGSDYTLIDNAFNSQGSTLAAEIANPTAQLAATSAVPEPTAPALVALASLALLKRRRQLKI